MYLVKQNAFNFLVRGDKKKLAEDLHMDRGIIIQILNGKRTTKYTTARVIVEKLCNSVDVDKYFDRVK